MVREAEGFSKERGDGILKDLKKDQKKQKKHSSAAQWELGRLKRNV